MKIATKADIKVLKVIHDDKWVTADVVDVELNNGKAIKNFLRITAKNGGYVMVVPRLKDGRFVLTRQFKPVSGMTIEGIAGSRENNELWDISARRELLEETGYKPGSLQRVGQQFFPLSDRVNNPCHLYLAFDCELSNEISAQDEVQGVEHLILTKERVVNLIAGGDIKDLATVAGFYAHLAFSKEGVL